MKKAAWNLEDLTRKTLDWIRNPKTEEMFWKTPVAEIRSLIDSKKAVRDFVLPLWYVGTWEGMNGALAVLNGDHGGWGRLAKSANFWYWDHRIEIHRSGEGRFRINKLGMAYTPKVALCLAHLMANGWIEQAKWLGDRLVSGFSSPKAPFAWPNTPFEPFITCLFQKWQGVPEDERVFADADLEVYGPVLASLEADEASFESAVVGACDYHVERIGDPDDLGYPEFHWPVYNVFPAEILAIERVRGWLGHPVPRLEHVILDNPLARLPEQMPTGDDELWIAAVEKAKSVWRDFL